MSDCPPGYCVNCNLPFTCDFLLDDFLPNLPKSSARIDHQSPSSKVHPVPSTPPPEAHHIAMHSSEKFPSFLASSSCSSPTSSYLPPIPSSRSSQPPSFPSSAYLVSQPP